ncbi:MAG: hypothetical protein JWM88_993 [Verrucomicrobia bacterium]|nr:hypothetical protein [Verrucomicrobiota bacterium]
MKTYVTYGFFMALGGFLLALVLYFLGFHSDAAKYSSIQIVNTIALIAISVAVIALGTRARRADVPVTEEFGYGRALLAGFLITLFACLFGLITNFLYFQVINPGISEVIVQSQLDKLEAKGVTGARLEQAEKMTRMFMKPAIFTIVGFLGGLFWGTIISLIVAAFMRRKAVEVPVAA